MKGLELQLFKLDLHKVEPDSKKPAETIDWSPKIEPFTNQMARIYTMPFDFEKEYHRLYPEFLVNFSFDELCKLKYSTIIYMDQLKHLFEKEPQYEIFEKIKSSMWRWGCGSGTWNEIVDAYDNIRHFSLGNLPDFEIRLVYTTGCNERGWAKDVDIYLDGVFGFLLYHKGKHVLTIGFSIMEERRLLIQQVQSSQRTGNRSLFKLPSNRMEFVIDLFTKNFPGYELYVIDGNFFAEKYLSGYRERLENNKKKLVTKASHYSESYLETIEEECSKLEAQIANIESRKSKIVEFYRNTGRFKLGRKILSPLSIKHRPVTLSAPAARSMASV